MIGLLALALAFQCSDGSPPPCAARRLASRPTSVAVLYFDVRSPDANDSALAAGLTEAIIDELGGNARLQVVSRFAVSRYRGASLPEPASIGRTLGAGSLVTGVLQRVGEALQVRVELLAAATGRQLWREPYEGRTRDALALQRDIAQRVASSVGGQLTGVRPAVASAPTTNTEAYAAYLRGNGVLPLRTTRTIRAAARAYEEAVALDPGMVSAWARLAMSYALRLQWLDPLAAREPDSLIDAGMRAADRAVALDERNGEAWLARAMMLQFRHPRTLEGVREAFDRALALSPRSGEAWQQYADLNWGNPEERLAALRKANEYEPGRPITLLHLSAQTEDSTALVLVDSAIALSPGLSNAYQRRSYLDLGLLHDTAAAIRDLETMTALMHTEGRDPWSAEASVAVLRGDSARARAIVRAAMDRYAAVPHLHAADAAPLAEAALRWFDDRDAALSLFERIRPRSIQLYVRLRAHTELANDPRYAVLLEVSRPPVPLR